MLSRLFVRLLSHVTYIRKICTIQRATTSVLSVIRFRSSASEISDVLSRSTYTETCTVGQENTNVNTLSVGKSPRNAISFQLFSETTETDYAHSEEIQRWYFLAFVRPVYIYQFLPKIFELFISVHLPRTGSRIDS